MLIGMKHRHKILSFSIFFSLSIFPADVSCQEISKVEFSATSPYKFDSNTSIKAWNNNERESVALLLKRIEKDSRVFFHNATDVNKLFLLRSTSIVAQSDSNCITEKRSASAQFRPGSICFADSFFALNEKERKRILIHELVHSVDQLNQIAFSKEWQKYYQENFSSSRESFLASQFDANPVKSYAPNLAEALADSFAKCMLREHLPQQGIFNNKIVPLINHRKTANEKRLLQTYTTGYIELYRANFVISERHFRQAALLDDTNIRPKLYLATLFLFKRDYEEALRQIDGCVSLLNSKKIPADDSLRLEVYKQKGLILSKGFRKHTEAASLFKLVLDHRPNDSVLIEEIQKCEKNIE